MDDVMTTVKEYILTTFLPGENPALLTPSTELIQSGILDSLATLELVSFLESRYSVELEAHDVDASNLGTLSAIDRMIRSKLAAKA
jgi:acyl carrier protein